MHSQQCMRNITASPDTSFRARTSGLILVQARHTDRVILLSCYIYCSRRSESCTTVAHDFRICIPSPLWALSFLVPVIRCWISTPCNRLGPLEEKWNENQCLLWTNIVGRRKFLGKLYRTWFIIYYRIIIQLAQLAVKTYSTKGEPHRRSRAASDEPIRSWGTAKRWNRPNGYTVP